MTKQELKYYNQKIDCEYGKLINDVKKVNYTEACIEGARIGFADELTNAEKIFEIANETEADVKELNEYRKALYDKINREIKPNLTPDVFTFPKGDPEKIYNVQLPAIQCANLCYKNYNTLNKAVDNYNDEISDLQEQNEKMFETAVCISDNCNTEKLTAVLQATVDESILRNNILFLASDREMNVEYGEAKKIKSDLQNAGMKAIIKNKFFERTVKDNYEKEKNKLVYKCNELENDIMSKINKETDVKHYPNLADYNKPIWIGFAVIFFPLLTILGILHGSGISLAAFLLPPFLISFFYVFCGYSLYFINTKAYHNSVISREKVEIACDTAKQTAVQAFKSQFDFFVIYDEVDKIIAEIYDKRMQALKRVEQLQSTIAKIYKSVKKDFKETINYLPSSLDLATLPRISELMEKGTATDYKTALWQVEQEMQADRANKKKLEILKAAETAKQAELRAQRYVQEYYERQRLEAVREQAESQRRTEEFARKQAEAAENAARAAERNAEASAAAAKAAEKQAEDTEELLRRTNDPYYINKWKNGQ